jgi:hypothetical protein
MPIKHSPGCNCCQGCIIFDINPNEQTDSEAEEQIAKYTDSSGLTIEPHISVQKKISIAPSAVITSDLLLPLDYFYVSFSGIDSFWSSSDWPAINRSFLVEFFATDDSYYYGSEDVAISYKHEYDSTGYGPDPIDPSVTLRYRLTLTSRISSEVSGSPSIVTRARDGTIQAPSICIFDDTAEVFGARVQPTANGQSFVFSLTDSSLPQGSDGTVYLQSLTRQRYDNVPMRMRITNLSASVPLELYRIVAGRIGKGLAPKCVAVPKRNQTYILNAPIAFSSDIGAPNPVAAPRIAGHEPQSLSSVFYGVFTDPTTGEPTGSVPIVVAPAYDVDTVTSTVVSPSDATKVRRRTEQYFYYTSFSQVEDINKDQQIKITPLYRTGGKVGLELEITLGYYTTSGTSAGSVTQSLTTYTDTTSPTDITPPPPWTDGTVTTTVPIQNVIFAGWGGSGWGLSRTTVTRLFIVEINEWGVGAFPGFTLHCRVANDTVIAGVKHISVPDVDTSVPNAVIEIEFWRSATQQGSIFTRDITWPDTIDIINAGDFYDEP